MRVCMYAECVCVCMCVCVCVFMCVCMCVYTAELHRQLVIEGGWLIIISLMELV